MNLKAEDMERQSSGADKRKSLELERSTRERRCCTCNWIYYLNPFRSSIRKVESRFGTGIASLFHFEMTMIYLNLMAFLLWFGLICVPWFLQQPAAWKNSSHNYKGFVGLTGMESSW